MRKLIALVALAVLLAGCADTSIRSRWATFERSCPGSRPAGIRAENPTFWEWDTTTGGQEEEAEEEE